MAQKIDDKLVEHLAHLARLEFDGDQKQAIKNDLNRMLEFVDKLNELSTDGVEPLVYMTDDTNVLREDDAKNELTQKEALSNAPKKDSDYFKVPKVVEKK